MRTTDPSCTGCVERGEDQPYGLAAGWSILSIQPPKGMEMQAPEVAELAQEILNKFGKQKPEILLKALLMCIQLIVFTLPDPPRPAKQPKKGPEQ